MAITIGSSGLEPRECQTHGPEPSDPAVVASERLEQLRTALHGALDQLETLARQRLSELAPTDATVERRLRVLQGAQAEFRSEVERWERSRLEQLDALEQDRRELAQAWERLEEEQVAASAPPSAAPRSASSTQPRSLQTTGQTQRPAATSTEESQVTRSILEQFEVLRRDVRRNADGRRRS